MTINYLLDSKMAAFGHLIASGNDRCNGRFVRLDLGFERLVLLLQRLDRWQRRAQVGRRRCGMFLVDPRQLVVDVAQELIELQRILQIVPPDLNRLVQRLVSLENTFKIIIILSFI